MNIFKTLLAFVATSFVTASAYAQEVDYSAVEIDFSSEGGAVAAVLGIGLLIFQLAIFVVMVASGWKIFAKAGQPGWACLVPIYNMILLLDIVKKPWWWLFLMFLPIVNIVILLIVLHRLSLSFGKGVGTTVGLVFLGFVFYPMLAFGDAKYTPLQD